MLFKLIKRISPGLASRMEQESRQWMIHCKKCGHEKSVWDAGGVRYKARGTVWRMGKCSNCGRWSMLKIYRPQAT